MTIGTPTLVKRLNIPKRIYTKDIAPHIGDIPLDKITARDIRTTITAINDSGRPAVANDSLGHCKQLFNHGMKLNPASAFTVETLAA